MRKLAHRIPVGGLMDDLSNNETVIDGTVSNRLPVAAAPTVAIMDAETPPP